MANPTPTRRRSNPSRPTVVAAREEFVMRIKLLIATGAALVTIGGTGAAAS